MVVGNLRKFAMEINPLFATETWNQLLSIASFNRRQRSRNQPGKHNNHDSSVDPQKHSLIEVA